jgi:putative colanic acid biosynthesis UDP-glucose lipid carrier transferase
LNTFTQRIPLFLYTPFLLFELGISLSFLYVFLYRYVVLNPDVLNVLFGTTILIWGMSALAAKLYYYERNLTYTKQLQRFIFSCALFSIINYLGSLFFSNVASLSPYVIGFFFLVIFVTKAITISMLFWLRQTSQTFQKKILVYDSKTGSRFIQDIQELKRTGYEPVIGNNELFEEKAIDKLKETVHKNKISTIFIPFEIMLKKSKEHIINLGWDKENKIRLIARYDFPITGSNARFFGLTQVIRHRISPLDYISKKFYKRIFDVFFSSLVIVVFLSWFAPFLGIVIMLDSKGPIFFIQKRPGRYGKMFPCIKFRSMTVNNSTEKAASRNDARTTRIGRFIRKTSIDELPQFFNVFFGHMSVVGPRPNLTSQNKYYSNIFKEYSKRMYLKPGITGLAQVSGARGGIENDIEMKHRIKYDIFYIRNWSFALDIKIIIRTVLNVIKGEDKAY